MGLRAESALTGGVGGGSRVNRLGISSWRHRLFLFPAWSLPYHAPDLIRQVSAREHAEGIP